MGRALWAVGSEGLLEDAQLANKDYTSNSFFKF